MAYGRISAAPVGAGWCVYHETGGWHHRLSCREPPALAVAFRAVLVTKGAVQTIGEGTHKMPAPWGVRRLAGDANHRLVVWKLAGGANRRCRTQTKRLPPAGPVEIVRRPESCYRPCGVRYWNDMTRPFTKVTVM